MICMQAFCSHLGWLSSKRLPQGSAKGVLLLCACIFPSCWLLKLGSSSMLAQVLA